MGGVEWFSRKQLRPESVSAPKAKHVTEENLGIGGSTLYLPLFIILVIFVRFTDVLSKYWWLCLIL